MPQPSFVHLRLHSEYSISDGMVRVDGAVAAAHGDAMPALALTDLSNVFGLVKFYQSARGKGLKPIVGCDVFISNDADRDRPHRLLLLCQSREGYLLLCRLLSRAYLENQHRGRAELRREWFHEGTSGLIALSSAHLGDVGCALLSGNAKQAEQFAQEWAGLFNNRYYLEVQRAGFADEEHYIQAAAQLAAKLGLPVVATHPVQFLAADDFKAHEARVCIAEGYVLNDKRRARQFTAQQYFKTQAEMAELFADLWCWASRACRISPRRTGRGWTIICANRRRSVCGSAWRSCIPTRQRAPRSCRSIRSGSTSRPRPSSRWASPATF